MTRSGLFRPHGEYEAKIDGSILIVTVCGSWNIEMHQAANVRARPMVERLEASGSWGTIVIVTDTLVSSLEVLEAGRKAVQDMLGTTQMKALAWVIPREIEGYVLLVDRYRDMYVGLLETATFETQDEARAWMQKVLASN